MKVESRKVENKEMDKDILSIRWQFPRSSRYIRHSYASLHAGFLRVLCTFQFIHKFLIFSGLFVHQIQSHFLVFFVWCWCYSYARHIAYLCHDSDAVVDNIQEWVDEWSESVHIEYEI